MSDPILELDDMGMTLVGRDRSSTEVTKSVSLAIERGEFVSIVGPSGCGKTTLLRVAAGLRAPTRGQVRFAGRPLNGVADGIALVFQQYNKSLFPWLSVGKNVAMGARSLAKDERAQRVSDALRRVGLAGFASRYPWELSGGMQQRAALARALVADPSVLMMDEPFASVDALTRSHLEDVVASIFEESSFAALLVTHDVGEAVYLADRVMVLSSRPSRILADIKVDLPRPRSQRATRTLRRFVELESQVLELVEGAARESIGISQG
jgi:NitT/TauT family transport system ATP-binding protein